MIIFEYVKSNKIFKLVFPFPLPFLMWLIPNLKLQMWLAFVVHNIYELDSTEVDQNVLFEAQMDRATLLLP